MNLVFTVGGENAFKLVKRDPGWELLEWKKERISEGIRNKGATIPARWETMNKGNGCYPSNVDHALSIMTDNLYHRGKKGDRPALDCLTEIQDMLRTIGFQAHFVAESVKEKL